MRKPRYRKLKWLSLAASIVSFCLLVTSYLFEYGYTTNRVAIAFGEASFCFSLMPSGDTWDQLGWYGVRYEDEELSLRWKPWFGSNSPWPIAIVLPLWIPTLLSCVAAFYFHRKARVPGPGHCLKCGYNLTGNESGICPECGTSYKLPVSSS